MIERVKGIMRRILLISENLRYFHELILQSPYNSRKLSSSSYPYAALCFKNFRELSMVGGVAILFKVNKPKINFKSSFYLIPILMLIH